MDPAPQQLKTSRLRLAETTSSVGAGVIGFGIGVLASHTIPGAAYPALFAGLLLHFWGMFDKHRIEAGRVRDPGWSAALYWICWLVLAALVGYLAFRLALPS